MKELWREYGKTVSVMLVAGALLLLVIAVWSVIGGRMEEPAAGMDAGSDMDGRMLQDIHMRKSPVITYDPKQILTIKDKKAVAELFQAVDADGNILDAEIISIQNQDGEEVEDIYEKPGIYFIEVQAEDAYQKYSVCSFRIPVNGGGV